MLVHAYATSPRKTKWSEPHHIIKMLHFVLFYNVTWYTNSIVSRIHVNTTNLCNITCTLVATGVILWSVECTWGFGTGGSWLYGIAVSLDEIVLLFARNA